MLVKAMDKYVIYMFTIVAVCILLSHSKTLPKKGPYLSYVVRAQKCRKTTYPPHKDPPITICIETYNTTTKPFQFSFNFTVKSYTKNVKFNIKSSIWENGKWNRNYMVMDVGCRGVVTSLMNKLFQIQFDEKHCAYLQTHVAIHNLSANYIHHMFSSTLEYGRTLWVTEMYQVGQKPLSLTCWESEVVIVPA